MTEETKYIYDLMKRVLGLPRGTFTEEQVVHLFKAVMTYEGLDQAERDYAVLRFMELIAGSSDVDGLLHRLSSITMVGSDDKLH